MHLMCLNIACGCRLVLVKLSEAHFGFGLGEWQGGSQVNAAIHAIQDNFTIVGWNLPMYNKQKAAKDFLFQYLQAALDEVSCCPMCGTPVCMCLMSMTCLV